MFDDLAIVKAVTSIAPLKEDFLSFRVVLSPQKKTTYAGMSWAPTGSGLFETVYEFSDGVTIDNITGMLVIPQNVSSFTISRKINDNDSDDFLLSPDFYVNDVPVSNLESEGDIVPSALSWVTRVQPLRNSVIEGDIFTVTINLVKSNRESKFDVALAGNSSDIASRANWIFSNNVRWNSDRSKIIVPAGIWSFTLKIATKSDNLFTEKNEPVWLSIDGLARALYVVNVPAGQVTRIQNNDVNGITREGAVTKISVSVVRQRFSTSLTVAATGKTADIEARREWRFSNGVRWNNDFSRLIVPANVSNFTMEIDTKADDVKESTESVNLTIGSGRLSFSIANIELRKVLTANFAGTVVRENYPSLFAFFVTFDIFTRGSSEYFKVNFGGGAFQYFDWRFSSGTRGVDVFHYGNGLFRVRAPDLSSLKNLQINAYAPANSTFAPQQVGWVSAMGADPSKARRFTIGDNLGSDILVSLPTFFQKGFVRSAKELIASLSSIRTNSNTPFLDLRVNDNLYLVHPDLKYLYNKNPQQTFRQFLSLVIKATEDMRKQRMNSAQYLLSTAYAVLDVPNFTASRYRESIMVNAFTFLNQTKSNLSSSLSKALDVRVVFADLMGSADLSDTTDRQWIGVSDDKKLSAISIMWNDYYRKFNEFLTGVEIAFDQIKVAYGEAEGKEASNVMNIISAVLSGFAIVGSVGFFVSNFRAAWTQLSNFRNTKGKENTSFSEFFQVSINAPAAFGSATLLAGNSWATIVNTLKSIQTGTAGFGNFDGPLLPFATSFNETNQTLESSLKKFEEKYLDMLFFVLREGGAGDADKHIRLQRTVGDPIPWQKGTDFLTEPGYIYAWATEPIFTGRDSQLNPKYEQHIWGIPLPDGADPRTVQVTSPIALDLLGDGLDFTPLSRRPLFDADHDGRRDRIAWIGEGTALLAYDVDGDGAVTRTDEISFVSYKEGAQTDLEGLTAFDSNCDMVFDAHDALWHRFGVWQDKNQDGVTQRGEFVSLTQAGIASISLVSDKIASAVGDVLIYGRSSFTRIDGTTGTVGDVGFRYANA